MAIDIAKLKPAGESSEEIEAALARIAAARGEAEATLVRARAVRKRLLIEGSQKEFRAAEQTARDAEIDVERVNLLEAQIAPTLQPAQERERAAAHAAAVAALKNEIERSNKRWDTELQKHVEEINSLVGERQELARRARQLGLTGHAADLARGTEWTAPTNEQMRHEQLEAAHLAQIQANEAEYERRLARRKEWQEQAWQIDEQRRAAEEDAARRGLRELPSPVRIVNG